MVRKILASVAVVTTLGSFAALGVYSAFSDTTQNDNNRIKAGTVDISANDTSPLYSVGTSAPGAKPGDGDEHCITVTYSGSLPATVKMYRTGALGSLAQYVDLTITKGASTYPYNCTGFTPAAGGTLFSAKLDTFVPSSFTNGLALTDPTGDPVWNTNEAVTYKIRGELANNNLAQ